MTGRYAIDVVHPDGNPRTVCRCDDARVALWLLDRLRETAHRGYESFFAHDLEDPERRVLDEDGEAVA